MEADFWILLSRLWKNIELALLGVRSQKGVWPASLGFLCPREIGVTSALHKEPGCLPHLQARDEQGVQGLDNPAKVV